MKTLLASILASLLIVSFSSEGMTGQNRIVDSIDGLIAYYPFTGNANDESGNRNHGKVYNATLTKDKYGKLGNAFRFNGSSYIKVPNSDLFSEIEELTVSFWIRRKADQGGTDRFSFVLMKPGLIQLRLEDESQTNPGYSRLTAFGLADHKMPAEKWVHYVFTMDSNLTGNLYRNGKFVAFVENELWPFHFSSRPLFIGMHYNLTGHGYNGDLDEIRIYNRAFTEEEIPRLIEK